MSFAYFNPYAQAHTSRSTFTASLGSNSAPCIILFNGLPPDVTEKDLRDVLLSELLLASSTTVKFLHTSEGTFMGMALVSISNAEDAEKVRRQYSGVSIDNTFRLTVQHVLPPTQPLPPPRVEPFVPTQEVSTPQAQPPSGPSKAQPAAKPKAETSTNPKHVAKKSGKDVPPGLELLSRMNKNVQPGVKEKQAALIAQQKANLKMNASSAPGRSLLNRMGKANKSATPLKSAATDKVNRAKLKTQQHSMDIDHPTPQIAKDKLRAKTQQELDEEMRLWERQRRFA